MNTEGMALLEAEVRKHVSPSFARETSEEVIQEIAPLFEAHYREIAHYQDIPLSVDYAAYLRLEARGCLRIYTIRVGILLVGYAIFAVARSMHYSTSLQARQDILYLDPEYRHGRLGMRFIAWCDEQLRAEGVQVVFQHIKAAHNFGPMLERLGYELIDHMYGRRLDGH